MKIKVKYIKSDGIIEFKKLKELTVVERNPLIRLTTKVGPIIHNICGRSLPF